MVYLHPESLSPDPTYGRQVESVENNRQAATLHPHRLLRVWPESAATGAWAHRLDLFVSPSPLELRPGGEGQAGLLVDFASELDAELVVELSVTSRMTLLVFLGESIQEAEGLVRANHPPVLTSRHIPGPGTHTITFPARGFRFARVEFHDLNGPIMLKRLEANATWTFQTRDGDFKCSDSLFQRVWQSSIYTARLCTRPDTIWDGIKRDRHGWFGDARIIKEATDQVFFDPRPAEAMLLSLPVEDWANGIPNYSFDAIAMLREHALCYGLGRDCIRPAFEKIVAMLAWARRTQTNEEGLIIRTERGYFFNIGFVDWSAMPSGGRFEELGWLQAKYLEGLRNASILAHWLGESEQAAAWDAEAEALSGQIRRYFWREGVGFLHTLNHIGPVANPHVPGYGGHYLKTYVEGIRLGPSGPSRQTNALAVLAGLGDPSARATILRQVFDNPEIASVITPYFAYYEQSARALCGDPAGALLTFREYIGTMLETEDASTIWEYYDPGVRDMRRFASSLDIDFDWPTSLCHGWGAGAVPLTTRLLLGITPTQPGFASIILNPTLEIPWSYRATVPTPMGPIEVSREKPAGKVCYRLPKGIALDQPVDGTVVEIVS